MTDEQLSEVNKLLPWAAGTILDDGRLLGTIDPQLTKRTKPNQIPDRRIVRLNERLSLRGKSVLEVGCFEGIHTIGLRMFTDDVTAIDIRPANVIKTLTRLAYHGTYAKVFQQDVELLDERFGHFDLIFHCGVLYHLIGPAEHLLALGRMTPRLFLDTHVAENEPKRINRTVREISYEGAYHDEGGWTNPFAGRDAKALWLTLESVQSLLREAGFRSVELLERREERNGLRVSLLALAEH
jgi:tRNA (mo5U34)-methyltransferase